MSEQLNNQTNNKERRFTLATEISARTRLDSFRDAIKTFQKEHSEVLGATIYGSMIKGDQAKATSDIDSFLYIDAETLPDEEKIKNSNEVESEYHSYFLKSLNVNEEESKYYKDLRIKLLSGQILEDDINSYIKYEKNIEEYKKILKEKYTYEISEEEKEKLLSQEPKIKRIDFAISGMFHARIGSGIKKYRQLFLDKINALSDKKMAEKIWDDVYFNLKTYEQRNDPNRNIKIPSTLSEALRVYHPGLYKNIDKNRNEEKIEQLKSQINNSFN